jgi:hypothetical protein
MNNSRSPAPVLNTVANTVNRFFGAKNNSQVPMSNPTIAAAPSESRNVILLITIGILLLIVLVVYFYYKELKQSAISIYDWFASIFETPLPPAQPIVPPVPTPLVPPVVPTPVVPQTYGPSPGPGPAYGPSSSTGEYIENETEYDISKLVDKQLPPRKQVFNISKNRYTYYDAEPLCKAMGAELATYDQVKQALEEGGDWCNYGWSQGQLALFPTQEGTWLKLQKGPEEQRRSCGKPGINGGYFDNPELRFGVNCYGVKPVQKPSDVEVETSNAATPMTPEMIEFDKKVSKYSGMLNEINVLPFNKKTWSA